MMWTHVQTPERYNQGLRVGVLLKVNYKSVSVAPALLFIVLYVKTVYASGSGKVLPAEHRVLKLTAYQYLHIHAQVCCS